MSEVKYITNRWSIEIEQLVITKETAHYIFYRMPGAREDRKRAKDVNVHSTWEAAREYMIARSTRQLEQARVALSRAKRYAREAKALPTDAPPIPEPMKLPAAGELRL